MLSEVTRDFNCCGLGSRVRESKSLGIDMLGGCDFKEGSFGSVSRVPASQDENRNRARLRSG